MKHHNLYTAMMMVIVGGTSTLVWAEGENTLPIIVVKAEQQNKGYTVQTSKSATKMDLALKDTPQSVSVMTSEQIQDQQLQTLSQVLDQTAGIYQQRYGSQGVFGTGGEYASYYARGSQIINFAIDGANASPAIEGRDGLSVSSLDPSIYENITVIKGATGLTTGAGNPSASIQLNRKLATSKTATGVLSLTGSAYDDKWSGFRNTVDVQGGLNQDGSVRGRAVVSYRDQDSWYDWGNYQTGLFYGTVGWDITDDTTVNAGAMYQRSKTDGLSVHAFSNALDIKNKRDVSPYPRWAKGETDISNAFLELTHNFANDWTLQANYNYLQQHTKALYAILGSNPGVTLNMTPTGNYASVTTGYQDIHPSMHSFDTSLSGRFALFGRDHQLSVGANYQNEKNNDPAYDRCIIMVTTGQPRQGNSCTLGGSNNIVNLNHWDGNIAKPNGVYTSNAKRNETDLTQYGAFAATRLNLADPLHVILGARFSGYDYKTIESSQVSADISDDGQFTPYAGVTFDITPYLTAYASYTNIFLPQNYRDFNYNVLDPIEGDNYEAGLKAAFYDNRLNLSAAYFQSKLDNVAVSAGKYTQDEADRIGHNVTTDTSYYRTAKGAKTNGFEIEANGEILTGWNIQAGYTYTETKEEGKRINIDRPKQQFKLYTTYKLPVLEQKLQVGGGVKWQSEIADEYSIGAAAYDINKQKAFTTVDLMARYNLDSQSSIGLNVNNVTDEEYRLNVSNATYGDPRNYILSFNYRF